MATVQSTRQTLPRSQTGTQQIQPLALRRVPLDKASSGLCFGRPRAIQPCSAASDLSEAYGVAKDPKTELTNPRTGTLAQDSKKCFSKKVTALKAESGSSSEHLKPHVERQSVRFTLRSFNSVFLGARPTIRRGPSKKRSLFCVSGTKPAACEMRLPGLTVRVRIGGAN